MQFVDRWRFFGPLWRAHELIRLEKCYRLACLNVWKCIVFEYFRWMTESAILPLKRVAPSAPVRGVEPPGVNPLEQSYKNSQLI